MLVASCRLERCQGFPAVWTAESEEFRDTVSLAAEKLNARRREQTNVGIAGTNPTADEAQHSVGRAAVRVGLTCVVILSGSRTGAKHPCPAVVMETAENEPIPRSHLISPHLQLALFLSLWPRNSPLHLTIKLVIIDQGTEPNSAGSSASLLPPGHRGQDGLQARVGPTCSRSEDVMLKIYSKQRNPTK